MNVHLLAPGPSLKRYVPSDAAFTLGVNRAATAFTCSYWCCLDYPLIRDERKNVHGNPSLLTRRQTWLDISGKVADFPSVVLLETLRVPPVNRWDLKTAPAALVFAAELGAKQIDVFGADWSDEEKDFDGVQVKGVDRTAERWRVESLIWDEIVAWLKGRGVEVNRI